MQISIKITDKKILFLIDDPKLSHRYQWRKQHFEIVFVLLVSNAVKML